MWSPPDNEEKKRDFDIPELSLNNEEFKRMKSDYEVLPSSYREGPNAFQTFKEEDPDQDLDKSQFDSRASEYFLMLNNKNQNVMRKRQTIKIQYSEDVLPHEQIYADIEKSRVEKEYELMQEV